MDDPSQFAEQAVPSPSRGAALAMRYRMAFVRHPVPIAILSAVLPLMAVASGCGIAAIFGAVGWAKALGAPLGVYLTSIQYGAVARLRNVRGQEWLFHLTVFVCLTFVNAVFVAGGAVSLDADRFGRWMIARELGPVVESTRATADALAVAATHFDAVAEYSMMQRDYETSRENYRKTCPASTGWGNGQVSEWRKESAETAMRLASRARSAAANARNATTAAQTRGQVYGMPSHDADMTKIAKQVDNARMAMAEANFSGARASLSALAAAVGPQGTCPDSELASRIATALDDIDPGKVILVPPFTAPPKPTEQHAVGDLFAQILAIFHGRPVLDAYTPYLLLSVLADFFAMSALKSVLGPRSRLTVLERFARKVGPEVDPERLAHAMREVEAWPAWQEIRAAVSRTTRWGRPVHKVVISADKQGLGLYLRWLRRNGYVHSGTAIGDELHFVLHPKTLDRWFADLICEWFRHNPAPCKPGSPRNGIWQ